MYVGLSSKVDEVQQNDCDEQLRDESEAKNSFAVSEEPGDLFLRKGHLRMPTREIPSDYLRAKRSKSAIWRSISSRAASEAERMPWMRSLNSSAFEARARASSMVMSCLE